MCVRVFVPSSPFETRLIFVDKARSPLWFTRVGPDLRLGWKGLPGDKHYISLRAFENYGSKKFYNNKLERFIVYNPV